MADYVAQMTNDLVEQFRKKPNVEALVFAIGCEFQEVFDFFEQLRKERSLNTAYGKQLDNVGDIVDLTRKEAGLLAGDPIPFDVIDDETYRQFLMFKVLKNTSNCTYGDVIKAFQMFWDRPLYYSEDPSEPATMTFDTGEMQGLVDTRPLFITPPIRAAGVTLKLYARTSTELDRDKIRILSGVGYAMTVTELPTLELDYEYSTELLAKSGYIRVTSDTLPPLEREYDISSRLRLGSEVQNMTLSELPTVERMFSYDSSIGAGIAVHSTMETTINGVTADK